MIERQRVLLEFSAQQVIIDIQAVKSGVQLSKQTSLFHGLETST